MSGSRGGDPSRGGALRLGAFYGVVAMIVAAVVVIVTAVSGEHAMPSIAGSYTASAPNACLGAAPPPFKGEPLPPTALATLPKTGPTFVVQQSGQFVNLTNSRRTLRGQLRLHPAALQGGKHLLTGTVHCVKGGSRRIRALAGSGPKPSFAGTLGGTPLLATFAAPPPAPGAQLPRTPPRIGGTYALSPASTCFGSSFVLTGAGGSRYRLSVATHRLGTVFYTSKTGIVAGDVNCTRGGRVQLTAQANDLQLQNVQLLPLDVAKAVSVVAGGKVHSSQTTASGLPPWGERFTASKGRTEFNKLVVSLFLAIVVVLIVARIFGALAVKVREPRVMGEVIAGILLGPSVLGLISPNLQAMIFPTDILPPFGVAANLGLVFFMFLIGLEVDRAQLRGKGGRAAMISNASVVLPMLLGVLVAIPIYKLLAPDKNFGAFALFVGVSMSITAFPVLARILVERRMLKGPVGALVVACAAIDDVTAWFLIALATTVAVSGSFGSVAETIGEAVAFTLFMAIVVRRLLGRMATAFDEVGHIPSGWFAAIVGGVLVSAFITEEIHIALIFGGFIMGIVMPRHARLTEEVTRRIEDFVVALLLPLFFVYSGLKTNVTLLDRPELWLITLGLIAIAIVGKLVGAALASRVSGMDWRSSAVVGTLMNTRGLTELIVLNIGLEIGVLSNALFAALVLMALVTTLMAGPLLSVLDPRNEFGEKMEDELAIAAREASTEHPALVFPERAILVAPQSDAALEQLLSIAEPLARSQPPRELILVRLLRPARGGGARAGLQTQNLQLEEATRALEATRSRLAEEGVAARSMAIISADAGADLLHIVEREPIDLVLTEGRRRLVGEGVPFGEVGTVLERAPSDVAVLVAREGTPLPLDAEHPVVVPFGGAEHEWAALELGSWLSSTTGAPLKLLGAAASEEDSSVTRMLGDAGLLVQHAAGVAAEPVVITRGREGVVAAASGAGVLVIGLSDRWRREGLGPTRSEIAKAAPAPVLFVRRGTRPGLFAARDSVTRFQWSMAASQVPLVAATDGGDGAGGSDAIGQPEESV